MLQDVIARPTHQILKKRPGATLIMAATAKTRPITVRVPAELAERVDEIADRLGRSRSLIVKQALSAWVDQEEDRSRLTREALDDIDAERVVDHQTVESGLRA